MNYTSIEHHVSEIAKKCHRDPNEITIVTIAKTKPVKEILEAYEEGCRDFGESRVQEALEKIPNAPSDIRWHFVGTLQKNKVRKAMGQFCLIHSVDSYELAKKISECSLEAPTSILLEVNTSGEETKHGFSEEDCLRVFDSLQELKGIRIEGLMTMAPFVEDETQIRACFRKLRQLRDRLSLKHLSMGMSHDFPIAIEEGATLLRIGTAIFEKYNKTLEL
jgi:pyridoxal phosphate enzyme (YggS family)